MLEVPFALSPIVLLYPKTSKAAPLKKPSTEHNTSTPIITTPTKALHTRFLNIELTRSKHKHLADHLKD